MWAVIECWRSAKLHPTADLQRAARPVSRLIAGHNTHRLRSAAQTATQAFTTYAAFSPTLRLDKKILGLDEVNEKLCETSGVNKDFLDATKIYRMSLNL